MATKDKQKTPDLSIIVTAHAEGLIAHKTMRCLFENQKLLNEKHISSEIIIHIDTGTPDTIDYFSRYAKSADIKIFKNNFHDLGKSRNFATKKATGKVIAFIDADDLVSSNWLAEAYSIIKNHKAPILVHPEAVLDFGIDVTHPRLWLQKNSATTKAENAKALIVTNRWVSTIAGPRAVFLDHPYPPTEHGFGNEDYDFNLETIANGIAHFVAPNTVLFYRKKRAGSLLAQSAQEKYVQRPSSLFDIKFYQQNCRTAPQEPEIQSAPVTSKKAKIVEKYIHLRNNHPRINKLITPTASLAKKITGRSITPPVESPRERNERLIPEFVIKEWQDINRIDTSIYPNDILLSNLWFYRPEENEAYAKAYFELVKNIQKLPEYIFIVPWVVSGGAERVLLNYLEAFSKLQPKSRVVVITTTTTENTWADHLPPNTDLVEFGRITDKIEDFGKDYLFSQFLVQLNCKKLHIINSDFGYRWIMTHRTLVKDNFTLNVSIFTDDTLPGSEGKLRLGYANPHVVEIYPLINRIFTDNATVIGYLSELNGFDPKKFTAHFQPNTTLASSSLEKNPKDRMGEGVHILWASRVCTPKHPELLCRLAEKLAPTHYQIDVFGRFSNGYNETLFDNIKTIKYRGTFDGIENLDISSYDFFLYTSLNDGIPNILLEIATLGLPIIASDAGGVGEIVKDKETGLLVKEETVDAFLEAINFAEQNPDKMLEFAKNAQKLVKSKHNWENFCASVKRDLL